MLAAGDIDSFRVVLDWVSGMLPLALARTQLLLPAEQGAWWTETITQEGLYLGEEYACDPTQRPTGYPVWLAGPGDIGGWRVTMNRGALELPC
jgi:hypothetical protein